jgi:AhpC/TSA family
MKRWLIYGLAGLICIYAVLCLWLYWLMHKPPEQFAKSFGRLPMIALMVFPFEPMWLDARNGDVDAGQRAPDFDLPTLDKSGRVRLSDLRGRPVLLVFGSYT